MKIKNYIKDKLIFLVNFIFMIIIMILIMIAFKINYSLIIALTIILIVMYIFPFILDFLNRKKFYDKMLNSFDNLDKKYLISEIIDKPNFYDGEILCQFIYEIDKYANEKVKEYENNLLDFKEFIEMWIHEIKIPVSGLSLLIHNKKSDSLMKCSGELNHILDYVEQVLYYVRSENAENDYLIREVNLNKIINSVIVRNKDYFLYNNVNVTVENNNYMVFSDSKWLEFIINQIISNSLKYQKDDGYSHIKIKFKRENNCVILIIKDNGIGITSNDLPRVFDKTFTGSNGRNRKSSTGIGLYICKNLCRKLGHKIEITSKVNEYTEVKITFYNNEFYQVIK